MHSRRIFLKNGAFALVSLGFAPSFLSRTALAGTGGKRLIAIFQRGACDALSMVVPFGDEEYYRARPSIAIGRPGADADAAIDLDGFFALNPRLQPLKPLWDSRQLAVVHACGSPDSTRSHFDAQDYLETATPGRKSTADGWVNRYLQARQTQASTLRAVALTPQLPRMLRGAAPALAIGDLSRFGVAGGGDDFQRMYAGSSDAAMSAAARDAFDAIRRLRESDAAARSPARGAEYPRTAFGQALKQIAQLARSDVGLEVAFAEAGGWDTHVNQGASQGQLAARLDDLARSISALVVDLGDALADTVVLTMTEFGRAVAENGSRGTDHGHGTAMLVIGGGIRGGRVYGRWPGLAVEQRYDGRDLAVTTDFRDVFAEIVVRHLGLRNPQAVFPGFDVRPGNFPGLFA